MTESNSPKDQDAAEKLALESAYDLLAQAQTDFKWLIETKARLAAEERQLAREREVLDAERKRLDWEAKSIANMERSARQLEECLTESRKQTAALEAIVSQTEFLIRRV
jgi:predicted RNase H-like nuclease (RuvC/YqgF family)